MNCREAIAIINKNKAKTTSGIQKINIKEEEDFRIALFHFMFINKHTQLFNIIGAKKTKIKIKR